MIVFETPGEIDLKAFTTFGLSVKETKSPIGRFGTGLKHALAILVRNGAFVVMMSGMGRITFATARREFRGANYEAIVAMPQNESAFDLPFTTQLASDWEMWQAFRELYSNTVDEGGTIARRNSWTQERGKSFIVVGHADFEAAYDDRDQIIIEDEPLWEDDDLAIHAGESIYMFYRGIRARTLRHPAAFRYNIKRDTDLTEDRTIKYDWDVDDLLAKVLARCTEQSIIEKALGRGRNTTEDRLDYLVSEPSDAFARAVTTLKARDPSSVPAKASIAIAKPIETIDDAPAAFIDDERKALLITVMTTLDLMGFETRASPIIAVGTLPGGSKFASRRGRVYIADAAFESEETLARCIISARAEIKGSMCGSWIVDRMVAGYMLIAKARDEK